MQQFLPQLNLQIEKLLDICQSTILNEELSVINIMSDKNRNTKTNFKSTFQISKYTTEKQKIVTLHKKNLSN